MEVKTMISWPFCVMLGGYRLGRFRNTLQWLPKSKCTTQITIRKFLTCLLAL